MAVQGNRRGKWGESMETQPRSKVTIHSEECKGCGLYVESCLPKSLELGPELNPYGAHPAHYSGQGCTGCGSGRMLRLLLLSDHFSQRNCGGGGAVSAAGGRNFFAGGERNRSHQYGVWSSGDGHAGHDRISRTASPRFRSRPIAETGEGRRNDRRRRSWLGRKSFPTEGFEA